MRAWVRWTSEWGPKVRKLIEIEQATGKTPQALIDAPVAYGLERELTLAYNFLAARRSVGFSANPIPLSEIHSYVEIFGPPPMPMSVFIDLLGIMDIEYLSKVHTKNHGNRTSGKR